MPSDRASKPGLPLITGLFGYPVAHTLSPVMHAAAARAAGIRLIYLPFEIPPNALARAVDGARALGLAGFNVTIPHKEAILPLLDRIDPSARRMGSVNTVRNDRGRLIGYNTDGDGFMEDLTAGGFPVKGSRCIVIGAGGAGRAVAHALARRGARRIVIASIPESAARRLAEGIPRAQYVPMRRLNEALEHADLAVNATPVGMHRGDPAPFDCARLPSSAFVYDVVYNRPTALIRAARARGLCARDGRGMLVGQGARAFEIWTGRPAPRNAMLAALTSALNTSSTQR